MENIRNSIRNIIYIITGVIATFLVFRIIFDIGAQNASAGILVSAVISVSDALIYPFKGIIIFTSSNLKPLNGDAGFAFLVYLVSAYLISKIVTGFLYDNLDDVVQNFVDGVFKLLEAIVILRILFELFAIFPGNRTSEFVNNIFGLTDWTQAILIRVQLGESFIDIFAIFCLAVIIFFDVVSGRYLAKALGGVVVMGSTTTKGFSLPKLSLPSIKRSLKSDESATADDKPKEIYIDAPKQ